VTSGAVGRLLSRALIAEGAWTPALAGVYLDRLDAHVTQQLYGSFVYAEAPRAALSPRPSARLHPPTLMLHGADDPAVRVDLVRGLERHADDYRLDLLPGLGHFCIDQDPETVVPRLADFLTP
jgi:pimeloyl-ACP methyl ester carboxylesterase